MPFRRDVPDQPPGTAPPLTTKHFIFLTPLVREVSANILRRFGEVSAVLKKSFPFLKNFGPSSFHISNRLFKNGQIFLSTILETKWKQNPQIF